MLKIPQGRLQEYVNWELSDVQTRFTKGRGTRDQIANICWIIEKEKEFQKKHPLILHWLCLSFWLCGSQQLWKILREMRIPDHLTCLLRNCMQVKKQQLELDMEQWAGLKLGKDYIKAVYCHSAYLTYIKNTLCEMLGWMKLELEVKFAGRNINSLRYADDAILMAKVKRNWRTSWWRWKRRVKKLA